MKDIINFSSCLEKQTKVCLLFETCNTPEKKYEKIIELGRHLAPYPIEYKTPDHIVKGCQSVMYLHSQFDGNKIHFQIYSEALISAGLAALLLAVYNDESPNTVLTCPPKFLDELGIFKSLSPGRSNGLASLFQRMKQDALNFLVNPSSNAN